METAPICILGSTACAWEIAARLQRSQRKVILAAANAVCDPRPAAARGSNGPNLEVLSTVRLKECRGSAGCFDLVFAANGAELARTAAVVILAESTERSIIPAYAHLLPAADVVPLSALQAGAGQKKTRTWSGRQVVFLSGLAQESNPVIFREVLQAALRLTADEGVRSIVLTRNLKVAGDGLEALTCEARAAGVLFFKFTNTPPGIGRDERGLLQVRFTDEASGQEFEFAPARLVLDEVLRPSTYAIELAQVLGLETDGGGFIQADNVHRLPVFSNRRGVIVAGPAREAASDIAAEASSAVLAVSEALADFLSSPAPAADIQPGLCIRCLTCLRICPYGAVALAERPRVQPAACKRCGLCMAECPREAIRMPGLEHGDLRQLISAARPPVERRERSPYIVIFGCRRSAAPAVKTAAAEGRSWEADLNLIEVPCAGSLPPEALLSSLAEGADGVLVFTCHPDNCHSRHGNELARRRAEEIVAFLDRCGAGAERLGFQTLAANMPAEAAAAIQEFIRRLSGPPRTERTSERKKGSLP